MSWRIESAIFCRDKIFIFVYKNQRDAKNEKIIRLGDSGNGDGFDGHELYGIRLLEF